MSTCKMPSLTRIISAISATLPVIIAEKCAAPPLNLPYRNVSTAPGLLHSGIPIDFGSTWQTVAFTPSLQLDNTFVPRFTNTCIYDDASHALNITNRVTRVSGHNAYPEKLHENRGEASIATMASNTSRTNTNWWIECGDVYGGGYEPSLSYTFRDTRTNNNNQEWWFKTRKYSGWSFITDTFTFSDYLSVYTTTNAALPAKRNTTGTFILSNEKAQFGDLGASLLGLTPDSTLLKQLHDDKIIPSTSWTLTNSSLCLGCTNSASSKGDFLTVKPSDRTSDPKLPCLLQTKVEALNWHPRPSVEGVSLIQSTFSACIDPGVQFLVFPNDVRSAFQKVLNREVKGEHDDYLSFKGAPDDDAGLLTVRIAGGLEVNVTIAGVGKSGSSSSGSGGGEGEWRVPVGKGAWGAYGNETWVLGKPFTDAIVLRWDASKTEYGLANLNPDIMTTTTSTANSNKTKQDLEPLGCEDFPQVDNKFGSATTTPGTGIIVGATIGGVIAGIVLAMAGLFFFKRGVSGVKKKYEPLTDDNVSLRTIPYSSSGYGHHHHHHHHQASNVSWTSGVGPVSPPPPSLRTSLASSMYEGVGGGVGGGMSGGMSGGSGGKATTEISTEGAIYEAPEGGTANPSKRLAAEAPG
ncbi:hypothetical protein DM02DRAFT_316426 [Periconia macrospinosa]|uniref:Acid protease n=1 Tax=Periconia macrospinosa TaxID=97972 RepID=A0A2V1D135_9PLEO|nr:hypothetical protein DM02DRAFT_316426 [Periconia macrospinosa]